MSRCSKCGAKVFYIRMQEGRPIAANLEPVFVRLGEGREEVLTVTGTLRKGTRTTKDDPKAKLCYIPHRKTCRANKEFSQHEYRMQRHRAIPKPPQGKGKSRTMRQEDKRPEKAWEQMRVF